MARKYSKGASKNVERAMRKRKRGDKGKLLHGIPPGGQRVIERAISPASS